MLLALCPCLGTLGVEHGRGTQVNPPHDSNHDGVPVTTLDEEKVEDEGEDEGGHEPHRENFTTLRMRAPKFPCPGCSREYRGRHVNKVKVGI